MMISVLSPGERQQLPLDKLKAAEVVTTGAAAAAAVKTEDAAALTSHASLAPAVVTWSQMPTMVSAHPAPYRLSHINPLVHELLITTQVKGGKGCVEIASITAATATTTSSADAPPGEGSQQWPLLPPCGFYGLEELDVRQCLECLEGAEVYCHPLYRFSLAQVT